MRHTNPASVEQLKHDRIVSITAEMETLTATLDSIEQAFRLKMDELGAEKARLIEHIGYDPAKGWPAEEVAS